MSDLRGLIERVEPSVYDKTGRPIKVGDVVKVYHFTAALRRKKHFMYKQAVAVRVLPKSGSCVMDFTHLNMTDETYHEWADGRVLPDYEIVQSVGNDPFEDRPRVALLRSLLNTTEGGEL
jgi:hypothetical protein